MAKADVTRDFEKLITDNMCIHSDDAQYLLEFISRTLGNYFSTDEFKEFNDFLENEI